MLQQAKIQHKQVLDNTMHFCCFEKCNILSVFTVLNEINILIFTILLEKAYDGLLVLAGHPARSNWFVSWFNSSF